MKTKTLFRPALAALFLAACTPAPRPTTIQAPTPPPPVAASPQAAKSAPAPAPKKEEPVRRSTPGPAKKTESGKGGYNLTLVDSASLGNEIVLTREAMTGGKAGAGDSAREKGAADLGAEESTNYVQGYRIQVYATTDFKEAERKKEDLTNSLSEKIYVVYESPFYKIRVGNFLKEEETKKLRKQLTEQGLDTWIVKGPIRKR